MESRVIAEGPAVVSWDDFTYYSTDTITLTPDIKLREITSSYYGRVDSRVTDKMFTLAFTPIGMMDDNAAKYFPWDLTDLGSLLMPGTDKPIVIYTAAGEKITIPAAQVIAPPQLILGVDRGPMGQMQFGCLGDITAEDAAADAHYTIETAAIAAHSLAPGEAPTPPYKLTLGSGETSEDIDGEEGFIFDLGAAVTPRAINRHGTINFRLASLSPSIAFAPVGLSEAEIMAKWNIQGDGAATLGASNALGVACQVSPAAGSGLTIVFPDCQIQSGSMLFGQDDPRHGQYAIIPVATFTAGVPTLYTITFPSLGD